MKTVKFKVSQVVSHDSPLIIAAQFVRVVKGVDGREWNEGVLDVIGRRSYRVIYWPNFVVEKVA